MAHSSDDTETPPERVPLERLAPEVLASYLLEIQGDLDGLNEQAARLRARIDKLETDRDVLRKRLEAERDRSLLERAARKLRGRRPTQPLGPPPVLATPGGDPIEPARPDLIVAAVLDPISSACFAPEFRIVNLPGTGWREHLEAHRPDLLFVESAFAGVDRGWRHRVAHFGAPHPELVALVSWCRRAGIPTAFWCKEDPINYGLFVGSASLFDFVFTVDANTVARYETDLGHDRIEVLPFAAQPALHHPPASESERARSVAFAGSYYGYKHDERRRQIELILDPARSFGLEIYDRMAGIADPRFDWPERYRPHVVGSLPYPEIAEAYRRYQVFLNVNTVIESPTMCARRIFELAASGTPVVSGPSLAIENMVPPGIVHVSRSRGETGDLIGRLLDDADLRGEASRIGPEWIADGNTYGDRVETVLQVVA